MSTMNDPNVKTEVSEAAPRKKQRRGFAAMDPAKQRAITSKGGKASHEQGTGHEWTSQTAREAGRKGGMASHGGRGKRADTPSSGGPTVGHPQTPAGSLVSTSPVRR